MDITADNAREGRNFLLAGLIPHYEVTKSDLFTLATQLAFSDCVGPLWRGDIGRRFYNRGGLIQCENNAQRARREL